MLPYRLAVIVVVCAIAGVSAPVHAQTGESNGRVFSSLFGGATDAMSGVHSLDLNAAVFAGYDDDIFARGGRPRADAARLSGTLGGVQGGLLYRRLLPRGLFLASGQGAARYVFDGRELVPTFGGGRVAYMTRLTTRTTLNLFQRATYQPFFSVVPFPTGSPVGPSLETGEIEVQDDIADPGAGVSSDFALAADRDALVYSGGARLSRELTLRSSMQFSATYGIADFRNSDADAFSNVRWRVGSAYRYRIGQYLNFNAGYGYRRFSGRTGGDAENHDINLGLNYNQPFRLGSGRTTLSFTTGSTTLVRERLEEDGSRADRFVWRLLGTATLSHDFSGPWQGQVSYIRSVGFMDGLTEPFMGDRVVASLGGLLGRRTDVLFSGGYVTGSFGLRSRNFDTTIAGARVRTALTRNLALFAQYFYYQYDFAPSVAETLFLPEGLERQGVRVGLTVWVPLLR